MPRNVRNFWLALQVDGKKERVETGPQSAVGGFSLTIAMRDKGGIETPVTVNGFANGNGEIRLEILAEGKKKPGLTYMDLVYEKKTVR